MVNNSCSIARVFNVLIMVRVHGVCAQRKLVAHTYYPQNHLNLRSKGNVGMPFFLWGGNVRGWGKPQQCTNPLTPA